MDTKVLAGKVKKKYHTSNPFQIADDIGFIVVYAPLIQLRGFQQRVLRRNLIYINSELDRIQKRLVCAHELGHYFIHRGNNRIFMDKYTNFVSQKIENEAHRFSVDLVYNDEELFDFLFQPIEAAANYMGVSNDIAAYRIGRVKIES